MPWYYDVTEPGETRPSRKGPFNNEQEASDDKTRYEADPADPEDVIGEPYQSSNEAPHALVIVVNKEGEKQIWSDGVVDNI